MQGTERNEPALAESDAAASRVVAGSTTGRMQRDRAGEYADVPTAERAFHRSGENPLETA